MAESEAQRAARVRSKLSIEKAREDWERRQRQRIAARIAVVDALAERPVRVAPLVIEAVDAEDEARMERERRARVCGRLPRAAELPALPEGTVKR